MNDTPDDPHAAARGIIHGTGIGVGMWALILLIWAMALGWI